MSACPVNPVNYICFPTHPSNKSLFSSETIIMRTGAGEKQNSIEMTTITGEGGARSQLKVYHRLRQQEDTVNKLDVVAPLVTDPP